MAVSKRSRAARRGWAQRGKLVDHIVTVKVKSPRKGRPRVTTRDIIVPARPGTRKEDLLWLIQKHRQDMPKKDRYAVGLVFSEGAKLTVATGPRTRGKKVKLR